MDDTINHSTTAVKTNRKKRQTRKAINKGDRRVMSKTNKTNIQFSRSNFPSTSVPITAEDNDRRRSDNPVTDKIAGEPAATSTNHFDSVRGGGDGNTASVGYEDNTKTIVTIDELQQKSPRMNIINTDDSENSSEEKGTCRKERKPLPLIFNRFRSGIADNNNNDSSSETSEDAKETDSSKCVYLGERETLRSFWDKCLYQCFKSKRCVAGEKPKRKYRKKPKKSKLPTKKRRSLDPPLSCIDTKGTAAVTHKDYLSRYETLLFMDPLADTMTPWQKKDFEMVFRMVKPADIFALTKDDNIDDNDDGESTDYTNSDTDQEV